MTLLFSIPPLRIEQLMLSHVNVILHLVLNCLEYVGISMGGGLG